MVSLSSPGFSATGVARVMVGALALILLSQWLSVVVKTTKSSHAAFGGFRHGDDAAGSLGDTVLRRRSAAATAPAETKIEDVIFETTAVPAEAFTPVPVMELGENCTCSSRCVVAVCDGPEADSADQSIPVRLRFARCTQCRKVKSTGKCAAAQPQMLGCSTIREKDLVMAVRRCIEADSALVPPKVFSIGPDEYSVGLTASGMLVCDNENVNTCTSKASGLEAKVLVDAARYAQAKSATGTPVIQYTDFGVSDPALASRFLSTVTNSSATLFALRWDSFAISKLQHCVNHHEQSLMKVRRDYVLSSGKSLYPEPKDAPEFSFIRAYAPGYEEAIVKMLQATFETKRPSLLTTHTPRGDPTKLVARWMLKQDYIAFQPTTCLEIASMKDLDSLREWLRPAPRMRPEGVLAWVERSNPDFFRPLCDTACIETQCMDGWRTQYNRCAPSERCGPSFSGTCDWNVSQSACPADTNWQSVLQCTDPRIPSPGWFSIVSMYNTLFACRGARDCPRELDVPVVKRRLQELLSLANQLGDGTVTPKIIDIGSGAGLMPVLLAKDQPDVQVYVMEPRASNRHLAKISACFSKIKNFHIIDAEVVAPRIPPLDSVFREWSVSSKFEKERAARRIPCIFHIASPDPTPVIEGAKQWLSSDRWRPGAVFLSVPRRGIYFSDPSSVWSIMTGFNYTAKRMSIESDGRQQQQDMKSISFQTIGSGNAFQELFSQDNNPPAFKEPKELDEKSFRDTSVLVQFVHDDVNG